MESLEFLKRAEEIMDNSTCWESLENEVLKFYLLICNCHANKKENGEDFISRRYLIEKCLYLLNNRPIILDNATKRIYATLRINREGLPPLKDQQPE